MSVLSNYALTTLANLKNWVGESSSANDTQYEYAINRATDLIETFLGRKIRARDWLWWLDARGGRSINLPQYPINSVNFVGYGAKDAVQIDSAESTDIDAIVSIGPSSSSLLESIVRLVRTPALGTVPTVSTLDTATYPRASSLATAIDAVTGFDAEVVNECAARHLHRTGPKNVKSGYRLTAPDSEAVEWRMDHERGILHIVRFRSSFWGWDDFGGTRDPIEWGGETTRFPREWQCVLVECNAGESTVPSDIEHACIELAASVFQQRLKDRTVGSETLGDYSYTSRAPSDALTAMEEALAGRKELR